MKTKAKKQADLEALTEQFKNSNSAMVLSFSKLTVEKDQQFRNELRETGADYRVVKNTLARLAIEGTPFETAKEHFKGVTSIATIDGEPIDLSKVISKYVTENKDIFQFKAGVVDGRVIDFSEVEKIATLPSKEELIGKLLYLFNAPAQRLATVLNAIPRDLAIVLKQVSERTDNIPGDATEAEASKEEKPEDTKPETEAKDESSTEETKAEEKAGEESAETTEEVKAEEAPEVQAKSDENSEEKAEEQKEEESAEEDAENSEEKES
ncbi:MAG: 50S ribosomal protein L10 [Aridibacter sp.]